MQPSTQSPPRPAQSAIKGSNSPRPARHITYKEKVKIRLVRTREEKNVSLSKTQLYDAKMAYSKAKTALEEAKSRLLLNPLAVSTAKKKLSAAKKACETAKSEKKDTDYRFATASLTCAKKKTTAAQRNYVAEETSLNTVIKHLPENHENIAMAKKKLAAAKKAWEEAEEEERTLKEATAKLGFALRDPNKRPLSNKSDSSHYSNASKDSEYAAVDAHSFDLEDEPVSPSILMNQEVLAVYQASSANFERAAENMIKTLATREFPTDHRGQEFTAQLIRRCFYHSNNVKNRDFLEVASILQEGKNTLKEIEYKSKAWLQTIQLPGLVKDLQEKIMQYYLPNSFEAQAFQQYLFALIVRLSPKILRAAQTTEEIYGSAFDNVSFTLIQKTFANKISFILVSVPKYLPNTLEQKLLSDYFILHIEYFVKYVAAPNDLHESFKLTLSRLQEEFFQKIGFVIILTASTPIWMTWYILYHHAPELFTSLNSSKLAQEKYQALKIETQKNQGTNGRELENQLITLFRQDHLSENCYLYRDTITQQLSFKSLERLKKDARFDGIYGLYSYAAGIEITCHLAACSMLASIILMATEVIEPFFGSSAFSTALSFVSAFFMGAICAAGGYSLRTTRVTTLAQTRQTLNFFNSGLITSENEVDLESQSPSSHALTQPLLRKY